MNQKISCIYYEKCSAPICPMLSDKQNKDYIWYPDEEICRRVKGVPESVKQQRKIAKRVEPENHGYYFTPDMLKVPFRVTKRVKGLDPDSYNEQAQLKSWSKRYRGSKKRKISNKVRDQKRVSIALARKHKGGDKNDLINAPV